MELEASVKILAVREVQQARQQRTITITAMAFENNEIHVAISNTVQVVTPTHATPKITVSLPVVAAATPTPSVLPSIPVPEAVG